MKNIGIIVAVLAAFCIGYLWYRSRQSASANANTTAPSGASPATSPSTTFTGTLSATATKTGITLNLPSVSSLLSSISKPVAPAPATPAPAANTTTPAPVNYAITDTTHFSAGWNIAGNTYASQTLSTTNPTPLFLSLLINYPISKLRVPATGTWKGGVSAMPTSISDGVLIMAVALKNGMASSFKIIDLSTAAVLCTGTWTQVNWNGIGPTWQLNVSTPKIPTMNGNKIPATVTSTQIADYNTQQAKIGEENNLQKNAASVAQGVKEAEQYQH